MRGMMEVLAARSRAEQDRNWVQCGRKPGMRRYVGDPASWPVVPVQPRLFSSRCGFDVRLPQLDDLSVRFDALMEAYDAFVCDMDQRGRKWTSDIKDNSLAVRENAQAVKQAELGSVARDAVLSVKIEDVDMESAARDVALSAEIEDVKPIDYSSFFERIISAQYDYRPMLSSMIQAQERIISAQHDYKQQLDVIIANQ